jgi:hypothetical protein
LIPSHLNHFFLSFAVFLLKVFTILIISLFLFINFKIFIIFLMIFYLLFFHHIILNQVVFDHLKNLRSFLNRILNCELIDAFRSKKSVSLLVNFQSIFSECMLALILIMIISRNWIIKVLLFMNNRLLYFIEHI